MKEMPLSAFTVSRQMDNRKWNGRFGRTISVHQDRLVGSKLLKMNHRMFQTWAGFQLEL